MFSILIISLAIVAGLMAFSQYFSFDLETKDRMIVLRYKLLSASLCATAILFVLMFLSYGNLMCYIFYGLDRFAKVIIMVEVIQLSRDIVGIDKKNVSLFLTVISYGAALLYFLDTLLQGGVLEKSIFGVYLYPIAPLHRAVYFVYYMLYIIMLIVFIVFKGTMTVKECEKHELVLLLVVYIMSGFGFVIELFIINYQAVYVPLALVFNLIVVIMMKYLLKYHESISIKSEKFEKELDPARTDIVFVLDDQMKIIYQNRRAEVLSYIENDIYVGRKISEVFSFSDGAFYQLRLNPDEIPFGISAVYGKADRAVNMVIQHRIDKYGNILATIVFVYNMEEPVKIEESSLDDNEDDEKFNIENAIAVTKGARALIVDEDVIFLNVFARLLEQFDISVSRSMSGESAIGQVKRNVFDIIFVTYEMKKLDGNDTVKRIREMSGDYYEQVPIVFITEADINDVFKQFIETGFNDYLRKPVSSKNLSLVLTRWLWQRFNTDKIDVAEIDDTINPLYVELNSLSESALKMYENKKYDYLIYCINGIKKISQILRLADLYDCSVKLIESLQFEDYDIASQLFERLISGVRNEIEIH